MKGRLVVLEGIDGSGKSTQYEALCSRLEAEGREFRRVRFPRYSEESSALIREYLGGKYGSDPSDVNAYAASVFYAVDRFASFRTDWKDFYDNGGLILMDRYTTSNACHQGSKLRGEEREKFLSWLYDFEFNLMELPEPDMVIYLNIDIEISRRQMAAREEATGTSADIHEKNTDYLQACLEAGRFAASHYGWKVINCIRDGSMRTIEDISDEIYSAVSSVL